VIMLANIFPPKESLKNIVMNILISCKDEELSVEEIRSKIKKNYNKSFTYQGINKILIHFKEEDIVERKDKAWRVKKEWCKGICSVLDSYSQKGQAPVYTPEMRTVTFKCVGEAFDFILKNIESGALKNNGEDLFISHVKNIAFFGIDSKQKQLLKRIAKRSRCMFLVEKKNIINSLIAKYFKTIGIEVYLGIPRSTPYTTTIYGDTVYLTYSQGMVEYMENMYKGVTTKNMTGLMDVFDAIKENTNYPVKFTFETDKAIVQQTKEYFLKLII